MNSSELILAVLILLPTITLFYFRISAPIVFLSLCLGNVLMQFVSPDAHEFLALFSAHVPRGVDTGSSLVKIILLLLPPILSSIFLIKTVKGNNKFINILPAIGVGALLALLLTPLLPTHLSSAVINSKAWTPLKNNQGAIVGVSSLVALAVLWVQHPKPAHEKGKHGK